MFLKLTNDKNKLIEDIAAMCEGERINYRKADILRKTIYHSKKKTDGNVGMAAFRKFMSQFVHAVNKRVREHWMYRSVNHIRGKQLLLIVFKIVQGSNEYTSYEDWMKLPMSQLQRKVSALFL